MFFLQFHTARVTRAGRLGPCALQGSFFPRFLAFPQCTRDDSGAIEGAVCTEVRLSRFCPSPHPLSCPFSDPFSTETILSSWSERVSRTEENMRFRVPFLTPFQQKLSQESCSELGVDWSRFSTDFQQIFNSFSTVFQQFFNRNCYKNPVFNILLKKE